MDVVGSSSPAMVSPSSSSRWMPCMVHPLRCSRENLAGQLKQRPASWRRAITSDVRSGCLVLGEGGMARARVVSP